MKHVIALGAGMFFAAALAVCTVQARPFENQKIVTFSDETTFDQRKASVEKLGGTVIRDLEIISAVVATFPEVKMMRIEGFQAQSSSFLTDIEAIEDDTYRIWIQDDRAPVLPTVKEILSDAGSSEAGVPVPAEPAPADASGITQYIKEKSGTELQWGVARVNAPAAWEYTQGSGVKVAVLDTGIDLDHPDLTVAGGVNIINSARNADDDNGHGTHVAGIIAALNNNNGTVGVAPKAKLYAVKVLNRWAGGNPSHIIAGIQWCIRKRMKVINISIAAPWNLKSLRKAIIKAHKAGIVIVCAVGNSEWAVEYPAAYTETIAVSASTSKDELWHRSCRGSAVDFIAPGVDIYSTNRGGGYATKSGTSLAAPHVTGLAVLAIARRITGPAAVKKALTAAAARLDGLPVRQQGAGMINALKVVKK